MGGTEMNIVLSILEVLGWGILILLLVVLLLLMLLLFCRLHYMIEGEWVEDKWARVKAHWLFRLIRAKLSYGDDLIYGEVHIFWKKMSFSFDFTTKKDEPEGETEEACEEVVDDVSNAGYMDERRVEEKVVGTETTAELRGEAEPWSKSEEKTEEQEQMFSEKQKESIVSKIKGIIERIKEVYPRIKKILTDEKNKEAVKHLKNEVLYLIKIFLPKKSKIDAVFSTGSPDTTGQLFGVLACFPAMYQKDWRLLPDFQADDAYFKGTFWGKGWIALYQIVGTILRIVFDKNCRRLYTMINKFIKWFKKDDKSQEEK